MTLRYLSNGDLDRECVYWLDPILGARRSTPQMIELADALDAANARIRKLTRTARAYAAAIEACANDPAQMSSHCTAKGDTLDDLYADWVAAVHEVDGPVQPDGAIR